MKQITQNKRTGVLRIVDTEAPLLGSGMILVKNLASVISTGTEKTTIDSRKSSMLSRARSQPEEIKKVVDEVKRTGLLTTYKRIMSKLDSSAALGYSSAGVVLAVDDSITDLEPGDRVSCAGAEYANHSDLIAVPRNLVAKVPDNVSIETAAYGTIAAIALQSVRQAEPTLGETVVVIGLGLIGQLVVQFLKANGCTVIGIDIDHQSNELALRSGADAALNRRRDPVEQAVLGMTSGQGADSVIITAGTSDNDPMVLAGKIARERGKVIILGATPIDAPRGPYYMKELDIRISRSYGPGRYNPIYEGKNLDFPIGYVRWTENRNIQAYLDLSSKGLIHPEILTTHRFSIEDAMKAYSLIEGEKKEPYVGIVLTYDETMDAGAAQVSTAADEAVSGQPLRPGDPCVYGFIGAGSFASGFLLPNIKAHSGLTPDTVCNRTAVSASDMKDKFGFRHSTTDHNAVLDSMDIGTVFIATRHGSHAGLSLDALSAGKNVFVEKPLSLNEEELGSIENALKRNHASGRHPVLMVGYNRRFAPLVIRMKEFFSALRDPSIIHYYVNAGFLPRDHWTHDPIDGGGRIVGEVCHFIDTIQFLTGGNPVRLHAENISTTNEALTAADNIVVSLRMDNGSAASIVYASNGDSSIPKERIVMSCGNSTAIMENFTALTLARNGKQEKKTSPGDKGHKAEIDAFINAVRQSTGELIPYTSLFATTRATFAILESLRTKEAVNLIP
jgi:polar amino acid transport system substrate-binding protein